MDASSGWSDPSSPVPEDDMQAFEQQHEGIALAAVLDADAGLLTAEGPDLPPVTEGFVLDVLAAVTDMALRSKRRQADLDAAMRHAGLEAGHPWRLAALERLRLQRCVDKIVELSDGGVLLSVTALGLDRLGGVRRR
jgi:hypothetical protein